MAKTPILAISIVKQGGDKRGPGRWTLAYQPEGMMGWNMFIISSDLAEKLFDGIQKIVDLESIPEKDRLYSAHDSREFADRMARRIDHREDQTRLEAARERNRRARERNSAVRGGEVAE
jgi:hypothetical protein